MSLGGLAPIGGNSKSTSAKRDDLTSGLMSLTSPLGSASEHGNDLDMDDFDVDMLLGDGPSASSKAKSPSSKKTSSSSAKKSSHDKSKSKDSKSKKKKESKKKSTTESPFNYSFEEDVPSSPIKKKTGLDSEFASILGLDDGMESSSFTALEDKADTFGHETSSDMKYSTAKDPPRINTPLAQTTDTDLVAGLPTTLQDTAGSEFGIDASFFADIGASQSDNLPSFRSESNEPTRRRGRRRHATAEKSDKEESLTDNATDKPKQEVPFESRWDKMFGGSKPAAREETKAELALGKDRDKDEEIKGTTPKLQDQETTLPPAKVADTKPTSNVKEQETSSAFAQDDLLADLGILDISPPKKIEKSSQDDVKNPEENISSSFMSKMFPNEKVEIGDDQKISKPVDERVEKVSVDVEQPKEAVLKQKLEEKVETISARDSLLLDLVPTDTPPRSPVMALRKSFSLKAPPTPEDTSKIVLDKKVEHEELPKPDKLTEAVSKPKVQETKFDLAIDFSPMSSPVRDPPAPSPGTVKTLRARTNSMNESEFEQSKESLLEEILSPPVSPILTKQRSSPALLEVPDNADASSMDAEKPQDDLKYSVTKIPEEVEEENATATLASAVEVIKEVVDSDKSVDVEPKTVPSSKQPHGHLDAVEKQAFESQISDLQKLLQAKQEEYDQAFQRCQDTETAKSVLQAQVNSLQQEIQHLHERLSKSEYDRQTLQQELSSARADLSAQVATCHHLEQDKASFDRQAQSLRDQQSRLSQQLVEERSAHQSTQNRLAELQLQTSELNERHRSQTKSQMDSVLQQLHTALARLQSRQEQASMEDTSRGVVEGESRMRMITSLEASARSCARQSEEECHRLASILSSLESTLRQSRQEVADDKERLRQEQHRLDTLASHFQAQTSVLHTSADANTQLMSKWLTTSLQDVRTAEARLATRRSELEDQERQLFDERAQFAAYREETMEQQKKDSSRLQQEKQKLDARWQKLATEKEKFEARVQSYDHDLDEINRWHTFLQEERQRIDRKASHVAQVASEVERMSQEMVQRESVASQTQKEIDDRSNDVESRNKEVIRRFSELKDRERRLQQHANQVDRMRARLLSERKASTTTSDNTPPSMSTCSNQEEDSKASTPIGGMSVDAPVQMKSYSWEPTTDYQIHKGRGSTLPPALRKLVDDHWRTRRLLHSAPTSLQRDRMWLHAIGLGVSDA